MLVGGHAQDLADLGRMQEAEQYGERAADPVGAGGQLCAPDGWEDRAPGRVGLHEAEQEEGHVLEVVRQPLGRALDGQHARALWGVGSGSSRGQSLGVDGLPQLIEAVSVQRRDPSDDVVVVDQ